MHRLARLLPRSISPALLVGLGPVFLTGALTACDGKKGGGDGVPGGEPAEANAEADDAADPEGAAQGSDDPSGKPEEAPGEKAGEKKVEKSELAKSSYKAASREEFEAAKANYKTHLDAGRKAVKSKDYATGIDELRKAKAISPTNSKVLGELGWAHFLNGDHDDAERELKLALAHVEQDATKGAVLYNLGRVAEQKGNEKMAADLYRQSVAVRPNDIVQKRLDGLGLGGEVLHAGCDFSGGKSAPTDLCQALTEIYNAADPEADWACEYNPTELTHAGEGEQVAVAAGETAYTTVFAETVADDYKATVFSLWDREFHMGEIFFVVVQVGDAYWYDELVTVQHPGVGYADENMNDVEVSSKELNGGGRPEIMLAWHVGGHDMDPGVESMEDFFTKGEAVITIDGGTPKWLGTFAIEHEYASGDMDPDAWGEMKNEEKSFYRYDVGYDGAGKVTVQHKDGGTDSGMKPGTYNLTDAPMRCPSEMVYY